MRIKRTDKNFTVRQKAGRRIHYAEQGKKYTENAANFSPKERQDALRQKNLTGTGTGIQAKTQVQRRSNAGNGVGDFLTDDTAKSYQQEYGNGSGNRSRDYAALGNLHVKRPLQGYQKESVPHGELSGNGQPEQQCQHQGQQQAQRPSAYHENTIKTKETVLHRKSDVPCNIRRADGFSLKRKKVKAQGSGHSHPRTGRVQKNKYAREFRRAETSGNLSTIKPEERRPDSGYAQPFSDRRDRQISSYKRKKFFRSGKEKYSQKTGYENTARKADTGKSTGMPEIPESYLLEAQPPQMQGLAEPALLQKQDNLPADNSSTSHIKKRNTGDSIRQRDERISGRKDKTASKDKKGKKDKGKDKDRKKDNSRSNGKSRKDRAAAIRLSSYIADKFSMEKQKDSLLRVAKDLLVGKAKAAAVGKLFSIGAALLPALIPAFVMVLIITLLFNSPFSILLPKLSEEPGAVEVLAEYTVR